MAYSITLAGQDITNYVEQMSIQITDTLGQGAGAGSSATPQGRATTIKFNCYLGPMNTAVGTLTGTPNPPVLVRQGEIIVTDATGSVVFGGYITKYTDISLPTKTYTAVEGIDYSTSLSRIFINESFSAQTDIQMIRYVFNKYAPWVQLTYISDGGSAYSFPIKNFRHVSVESFLNTIAGITGYNAWVDFQKNLHYTSPAASQTAPFALSDQADHVTSFGGHVEEFLTDDNAAINRVYFYGGKRPVNDFTQDVSPLANGVNQTFVFAFYPRPTLANKKIRVVVNGVDLVVGDMNGTGPTNTFRSKGGKAQALINGDAKAAVLDSPPRKGSTVYLIYRYELPLVLVLSDTNSYNFFGGKYFDGVISDETIFDTQTAVQRCKVLLVQQSYGLTTLKLICWRPGIQAGQLLRVDNTTRGIHGTYLVQEVITEPLGAGNFRYTISLGAWNWNIIDVVQKLAALTAPVDNNTADSTSAIDFAQIIPTVRAQGKTKVGVHDTWSKQTHTNGGFYARATAVGDGHDAYAGLFTV